MLSETWNMFFIWFVAILIIFRTEQLTVQHCWLTCFERKAGSGRENAWFFFQRRSKLFFSVEFLFHFLFLTNRAFCSNYIWSHCCLKGLNLLRLIKITHFLNHKHDPRKSLVSTSWYAKSAVISSGTCTPLLPPDYLCGSLHCWKTRSWEENRVFLAAKH